MRFLSLKIAIAVAAFSVGIGSIWVAGGFSYLAALSVCRYGYAISDIPASIEEISSEATSHDNASKTVQNELFPFEDYPVTEFYKGKNAQLKLTREERGIYGEKLQYTVDNFGVDFAGHYIVANWSCGMWCSWSAIIDAKTGKVYGWDGILSHCFPDLDKDFPCNAGFSNVAYRPDSSLIVFFGHRFENDRDDKAVRGFHYYNFENGRLRHLKSVPVKEQRSGSEIQLAD